MCSLYEKHNSIPVASHQSLDIDALEIQAAAPLAPGSGASNLLQIILYEEEDTCRMESNTPLTHVHVLTPSLPSHIYSSEEGVGRLGVGSMCSESRD
jgi:hypothetical protein